MSKKINFYNENQVSDKSLDRQNEKKMKELLNQEFPLPDVIDRAKSAAFERIRAKSEPQSRRKKFHKKRMYKAVAGVAAAGAIFSTVCITNPAWAEDIPLI